MRPPLYLAQGVGLVGDLLAALLALDKVAGIVLGGSYLLAAHLGVRGKLLLHHAARLALRSVPLHCVTLGRTRASPSAEPRRSTTRWPSTPVPPVTGTSDALTARPPFFPLVPAAVQSQGNRSLLSRTGRPQDLG